MVIQASIQNLLEQFVQEMPDVQGAAVVSPDGLAIASSLSEDMDEDKTSAMSAAILSIGDRIGEELVRGDRDRLVLESTLGYSILVGCTNDAVLLVLAKETAKLGLLFLEIKYLTSEVIKLFN